MRIRGIVRFTGLTTMILRNTLYRYGTIAQFFHWLIVALIATQFTLAYIFSDMPLGLEKIGLIVTHKAIGMTVLILMILRLSWRFLSPPPALPTGTKSYERFLANAAHVLLYALVIALPLSGWLMSSAANIPVSYFAWFDFPVLVEPNKDLVKVTKTIHYGLNITLACMIFLHVVAALRHHFILRDDVLRRMLPQWFNR